MGNIITHKAGVTQNRFIIFRRLFIKIKLSFQLAMLVFFPAILLPAQNTASNQNNPQLKFELLEKTKATSSVKICIGASLRAGKRTWNLVDATPAKGDVFWKIKIRITNLTANTIKFNSKSDLLVKNADGESIAFNLLDSFDGTSAYRGGGWSDEFLPDKPTEKDILLALAISKANQVILLYMNENVLKIDF